MRRVAAVVVLTVSVVVPPAIAQTANIMQPTVPSPTAASLGKFGDIPVSYFSGVPQISIPLFTAKGKTLELPIALSYHASGIKVEEIGGWVGAGWSLEAGGAITRTVRGIVDDQNEGYFNTGHTFYNDANWTSAPPASLIQNIHDNQLIDPEPDQFFFNFAGQSGEMVGGPTSTNTALPNVYVTIPFRKWRIVPAYGAQPLSGYGIISWVITTEDGTKYTFSAPEVHKDWSHPWQQTPIDSRPYASTWYLTEVRAPGGDVITLQYADYNTEHHTGMYREQANSISDPFGDCSIAGYTNPTESNSKVYDVHSQTYAYAKRLASITTAAHTITFTHSVREDARSPFYGNYIAGRQQQEPRLDTITVATPAGVVLRRFAFEYTYGGPLGGRLTLMNVYEQDSSRVSLPPYSFTYYSDVTMPARVTDRTDYHDPSRTASFALDFWGYYNGASGNATVIPPGKAATGTSYPGADRNPNVAFMKAGVLTKVTYPTGGFNEFVYEENDYSNGGSLVSDPQGRSASASVTGTGDRTTDFTVGGIDPTVSGRVTIYVSDVCTITPCPVVQLLRGAELLGTWTRQSGVPASRDIPWQFTRGVTYTLTASTQGQNLTAISMNAYWSEQYVLLKKPAGGLRIAEVRANDGTGNVTVRKYRYQLSDGRSSGWLAAEPRYDYDRGIPANGCYYYSRSSQPKVVLGSGPVVEYSVVTESLGVNGVFGSVRRTFEALCDCAAAAQAGNYHRGWPSLRYTTDTWRRGQELSVAEYSAGGQIQRSVATTYAIPPSPHPLLGFRGLAVDIYSMWGGPGGIVFANPFLVRTGLKVQTNQQTTVYDTTGTNSFVTSRSFAYGNVNHAQMTEIAETNSDLTQRITRMKYPGDYATGGAPGTEAGALAAMQDVSASGAHMPGVVIERSVNVKIGASDRVVQSEITTFLEFMAGKFLPYRHYVLNSPSPIP